ncbi:MAG: lipoate--protein ligase family protein [Chlorobiaceae bacterium]|nr:lipoate--protein ligase family protein [Chlorobiaceae bacterium]
MAFDMRLMQSFADGTFHREFGAGSCLWRFYSWMPSAVSLGRNQDPSEIDAALCRADGVDIVVRPTGGRAVFHADELTYSFFAHTVDSNESIYRMVHETIGRALEHAGVVPDFCRSQPDFRKRYATAEAVPCFTASAKYELQVDGRKIVGSAQRRRGDVILQHGSMPLSGRHRDIVRYISAGEPGLIEAITVDMERKTASLDEFTRAGYDELVQLIVAEGAGPGSAATVLQPSDLSFLPTIEEPTPNL